MKLSSRDRFIARVAAGYAVIAAAWFAISDSIARLFSSPDSVIGFDSALDAGFVIITTILLVATLRRVPVAVPLLAPQQRTVWHFLWYPFAIASTCTILWLRQSIDVALGTQPALILFAIPIALSAYLGGIGPGLTATLASALLSDYFLLNPRPAFGIDSPLALAQWLVLIAIGVLFSVIFEALKRSRSRAQNIGALQSAIVASSEDAIYSASPAGDVITWNRAAETLYGYTAAEMIGQPLSKLSVPDRENEIRELDESIRRGEATNLHRTQRRRKDGSIVHISLTASPVYNGEGQIIGSSRIARDIGELVRAEAAQQGLLATMRAFVEQAPIVIGMLDRDMKYLAASKMWKAEYGGGRNDLTGLNHYDVLQNISDEWRAINQRALAGETIRTEEDKWVRPDGTVRFMRSVVQPWIDADGKIGGIIIVDDDYTERKNAEDAFRESEERFGAVFRESPVGIVIFDLHDHCRLVDANDAWARITGFSREETVGSTGFDLDLWPDPVVRQAMYDQIEKPMSVWHVETQLRRRDGTLVDTTLTMRQIEVGGRPMGLALIYDDSGRKRLERDLRRTTDQLSAFIDASPVAIVGVDAEDRILTWSRAATEILGFTAEEALGHRFLELAPVPPEDKRILEERAKLREQGEITRSLPSRRRRKDGSWAKLAVSAGDLREANGDLIGTILVMEDVTEREKLQEQLTQSQKMEAIGQLTGGVAHDFNNLLMVILGNLELIQDQISADTRSRRWIEAAVEAGRNGADLVHRLLAFSRRQPLEPIQTDVNQRIIRFVPLLKRTLGEAIDVRTKLAGLVWQVMIDGAQFDSALLNLAVNARDAMPDGGWIEIATENVVVDEAYASQNPGLEVGNFVRISVSDSGHGMPPEVAARVFEPFFTTKETGKGTGLGLSMVYGFIKQSGGNVAVYSEVNKGTVVKLLLPRTTPSALPVVTTVEAPTIAVRGGETVLVVEDDPDVRAVAVEFLHRLGYPVFEASNTRDAVTLLTEHAEIALLFTDVILAGGETGVKLAAHAKEIRPDLKVLFASGYTEEALEHNRQLSSNSLLLHKPFTRASLSLKVREALGQAPSRG